MEFSYSMKISQNLSILELIKYLLRINITTGRNYIGIFSLAPHAWYTYVYVFKPERVLLDTFRERIRTTLFYYIAIASNNNF